MNKDERLIQLKVNDLRTIYDEIMKDLAQLARSKKHLLSCIELNIKYQFNSRRTHNEFLEKLIKLQTDITNITNKINSYHRDINIFEYTLEEYDTIEMKRFNDDTYKNLETIFDELFHLNLLTSKIEGCELDENFEVAMEERTLAIIK
nr:hypothetical protein [Moritella viscosa]SHO15768.1 Putative multiple inositol polyphosphate histidine phosphatase 1 [Moritella viscosa]